MADDQGADGVLMGIGGRGQRADEQREKETKHVDPRARELTRHARGVSRA